MPASLKTLRATYRSALAKIETDRAQKAGPLYDLYLGALNAYMAELTRAGKLDEALNVKGVRDEVATQKTALLEGGAAPTPAPVEIISSAAAIPASAKATKSASLGKLESPLPIPPEALAPPKKAEHTRELVETVLLKLTGRVQFIQGGKLVSLTSRPDKSVAAEDLPKGTYTLSLLDTGNYRRMPLDTDWLEGETDLETLHLWQVDFGSPLALRGMKKLTDLRIRGSAKALPDEHMLLWPPLPALKSANISGAFGHAGLRALCERCPQLTRLVLWQCRLPEGGLQPLQHLQDLAHFQQDNGSIATADIEVLARLPKLASLTFGNMDLGGVDFSSVVNLVSLDASPGKLNDIVAKTLGSLKKLTTLRLSGNSITDASLPAFGMLTELQDLDLGFNPIRGSSLASLGGLKNLNRLVLASTQVSDATLAGLPFLPALTRLALSDTAIGDGSAVEIVKQRNLTELAVIKTGIGDVAVQAICNELTNMTVFMLNQTQVTDAGIPALKRLKKIERLELGDTAITDASVEHLKKLITLKSLQVRNTKLTPEGIAELKKALPQCNVFAK